MSSGPCFDDSAHTCAQLAGIDAVSGALAQDARSWAAQLRFVAALAARSAAKPDPSDAGFLCMELTGAWRISQLTATAWIADAERMTEALPMTLALLEQGQLLRHQGQVLLRRTRGSSVEIARAVEAEPPAGGPVRRAAASRAAPACGAAVVGAGRSGGSASSAVRAAAANADPAQVHEDSDAPPF